MPRIVRYRLGDIRDTPTLTYVEKEKCMTVIISRFEDEIIYSSESPENIVTEAEKLLDLALPLEYVADNEKIDIKHIKGEVITELKKCLMKKHKPS
jgi:hypothetical protein